MYRPSGTSLDLTVVRFEVAQRPLQLCQLVYLEGLIARDARPSTSPHFSFERLPLSPLFSMHAVHRGNPFRRFTILLLMRPLFFCPTVQLFPCCSRLFFGGSSFERCGSVLEDLLPAPALDLSAYENASARFFASGGGRSDCTFLSSPGLLVLTPVGKQVLDTRSTSRFALPRQSPPFFFTIFFGRNCDRPAADP